MASFKFLHAADLHLGKTFQSISCNENEFVIAMRSAVSNAWEKLVNLAIENEVDFVCIAGDVYNKDEQLVSAQFEFCKGLETLQAAGIPAFITHGNHDPLGSQVEAAPIPESAFIFGKNVSTKTITLKTGKVVAISGVSFSQRVVNENLSLQFTKDKTADYHIGILHTNVGNTAGHGSYAPCTISDLKKSGLDYWALGHIHAKNILNKTPWIVYSGNPQALHINEEGERGCFIVEVENNNTSVNFKALDDVRFLSLDIPIDKLKDLKELYQKIEVKILAETTKHKECKLIIRLSISGRGEIYSIIQQNRHKDEDGFFDEIQKQTFEKTGTWLEGIKILTMPEINLEERKKGKDFIAKILNTSENLRRTKNYENTKDVMAKLLTETKKLDITLSEDDWLTSIDDAERLCLDGLEG